MKTWQAALSHIGLSALQVALGVQFFDSSSTSHAIGNTLIQLSLQALASTLQGVIAVKNSNTDPNGNLLVKVDTIDNAGKGEKYTTKV